MTTKKFFAAVIMAAMSAATVSGQVAVTKQGQLRLGKHQEKSAITELKCDQNVELKGAKVCSGGKLKVEAEELTLGEGFEVELGGEFEFNAVRR